MKISEQREMLAGMTEENTGRVSDAQLEEFAFSNLRPTIKMLARELLAARKKLALMNELVEAANKVYGICDKEWGELNFSVYTIEEDDYQAYWCRDLLHEPLKKLRALNDSLGE